MNIRSKKLATIAAGVMILAAVGAPQLQQAIKLIGVGAAVKQFGPDINKALNKLIKHEDTAKIKTKVVPILSVAIGRRDNAIGAAQVQGPPELVNKVHAVAQPETKLLGVRVRGLVPVENADFKNGFRTVPGVGVTGIVDLKL